MYRGNMSGKIKKVVMFMRICKIIFFTENYICNVTLNIAIFPWIDRNVGRLQLVAADELSWVGDENKY